MSTARTLAHVVRLPPAGPGFMGAGHTAVEVFGADDLVGSDPFVLLMDDRLDVGPVPRQMGGAHPHAGLETVTFFLQGGLHDKDEGDAADGDVQWMTAGSGIIHSEDIVAVGSSRILQLWIRLPARARQAPPRVQLLRRDAMPVRREGGAVLRLYSGRSGDLVSTTQNHVPTLLADVVLEAGGAITQEIPRGFNGFVYGVDGSVDAGGRAVAAGDVGWLDESVDADGTLSFSSASGGRVIFYAGERQNEPTIQHGPFVAGNRAELVSQFDSYQRGRFPRLSQLAVTR